MRQAWCNFSFWHETDMPMQSPMSAVGGSTDLAGDAARSLIPIVLEFKKVTRPDFGDAIVL